MINTERVAKAWRDSTAQRIGRAVQERRKARSMSVSELAERTRELGYPIHRVTLGKIESNNREGKFDVVELIVLAVALDIEPLHLLFPDLLHGPVEMLPGKSVNTEDAILGFVGHPDRTNARDETSLALFWDYREGMSNAEIYTGLGNIEAATAEARRARQSARYGREHHGWIVDDDW